MQVLGTEAAALLESSLRESFGDGVRRVGSHLLLRGATSLLGLHRELGMPLPELRAALLVLIQHNIARSTPTAPVRYEASHEQVALRPLLPVFVATLEVHLGKLEACLMEEVLKAGRLDEESCVRRTGDATKAPRDDSLAPEQQQSALVAAFGRLAAEGFIVPCEALGAAAVASTASAAASAAAAAAAAAALLEPLPKRGGADVPRVAPSPSSNGARGASSAEPGPAQRQGERSSVDDRSGGDNDARGDRTPAAAAVRATFTPPRTMWQPSLSALHRMMLDETVVGLVGDKARPRKPATASRRHLLRPPVNAPPRHRSMPPPRAS